MDSNNRVEFIGVRIILILMLLMISLYFLKQCNIDRNKVYVVGYLTNSSSEGSEIGWVHYFNYTYDSVEYSTSFGGPIGKRILLDSLMYIKISAKHPNLCEPVTGTWVLACVKKMKQPQHGWKKIPLCPE